MIRSRIRLQEYPTYYSNDGRSQNVDDESETTFRPRTMLNCEADLAPAPRETRSQSSNLCRQCLAFAPSSRVSYQPPATRRARESDGHAEAECNFEAPIWRLVEREGGSVIRPQTR